MSRTFLPHVITDDSALGGSEIERSLRFNSEDSTYLQRSVSSDTSGSSQKITISFWIKIAGSNSEGIPTGTNGGTFFGTSGDNHRGQFFNQEFYFGNANYWINTTALVRDPSSWYHVVYVVDTTQGTTSNRQKIYVNGVLQDRGDTISDPSQNATFDYFNNSSQTYYIGRRQSGNYFNGYLAEIHFIDGYAYDASYFGFTEQQTGIWKPKKVTGVTYGTNGFHLEFKDNSSTSALGKDTSGNGHNFTTNNFGVGTGINNDSVEDTPTNNWATLNPLHWNVLKGAGGTSNGSDFTQANLRFVSPSSVTSPYNRSTGSTIEVSSGKWYYEVTVETLDNGVQIGFSERDAIDSNGYWTGYWSYNYFDQRRAIDGTEASYGAKASAGDIIGCAFDLDQDTMEFFVNNSSQGKVTGLGISGKTVVASFTLAFWTNKIVVNFGQQGFAYTPPSGFKALCTKNLPPNVPSIIRPQRNFETLLYTGNGSTTQNITGLEFKPDFVWIKSRSSGSGHHSLIDSVRSGILGYDAASNANQQIAEYSVSAFNINDNNSIDVPYYGNDYSMNTNSATYVAWCWKAGGTAVTNTVGNISAQVSANDEAGFSIITYTGDGNTSGNVGTGLRSTQPLDWAIVKRRDDTSDWHVGHRASGQSSNFAYHTNLNDTSTLSGSTPYHMGTQNYTNGDRLYLAEGGLTSSATYVAYVWQERPGYSKFGSYTGNGSADGPFIYLGFRPAWFMQKKVSGSGSWYIFDNKRSGFNVDNDMLSPNLTDAEYDGQTYPRLDFVSNGIKWRDSGSSVHNASGETYIYMAFAEQPGTTSFDTFPNAR